MTPDLTPGPSQRSRRRQPKRQRGRHGGCVQEEFLRVVGLSTTRERRCAITSRMALAREVLGDLPADAKLQSPPL